jgi:hypothetical protein
MNTINTIEEIRRTNLRLLILEHGTGVAVAAKCDTSSAYLSQILIRFKRKSGKSREVGTDLARKLEKGCGKPIGWMDVAHIDGEVATNNNELMNVYAAMDDTMRAWLLGQAKLILQIGKK